MTAHDRFATDCQFSILAIVLEDPALIDSTDLQAEEFIDSVCAELWQNLSAHRTNSEAVIAETGSNELASVARNLRANWLTAPTNLQRHVRGLRRAKAVDEYAQTVRAKLGRAGR